MPANGGNKSPNTLPVLEKARSGIKGLDEITAGGLPKGRPTLVCGAAGSGKTLLAIEFLVHGARNLGEPGLFVAFEETAEELTTNVGSLGFDLKGLVQEKKLVLDYIRIEPSEIEETGEYDLEGLFIRLGSLIDSIGAKRIALDTLEALFGGFTNQAILRAELRRLFRWLKDRGVTAVITAERGQTGLTRHGLEEYVSDAVILLDHRVNDQVATRRARIVKYRGSRHGTNEYPFLIDEKGISILPVSSMGLNYQVSDEKVRSGVDDLDGMLGGGYFRGASILVSGGSGTGKTSLAAHFAAAASSGRGRCLYFAFEESVSQIVRNMRSVGIDLQTPMQAGQLVFRAARPHVYGLEMHLLNIHQQITEMRPDAVVLDPISNLIEVGESTEVKAMLSRLLDHLKESQITGLFTSLTHGASATYEQTQVGISSLMDTWLLINYLEASGERTRTLQVLKSRGANHSNQIREFLLTSQGVQLIDVYIGAGQAMTGSARAAQEAREETQSILRSQEIERGKRELERKRRMMEARISEIRSQFESDEEELRSLLDQELAQLQADRDFRSRIAKLRGSEE
jgi:circadian clock protein KaiC